MRTKLSAAAAKLVESAWLAALIVVPILFNQLSERTFDEDKIALLRSIAIVVLVGLIIWGVEEGRGAFTVAGRLLWRVPLMKPTVALAGVYVVSTALSVAPNISFWGAYLRAQGTYTWLSYVALFCAIVCLARRREHTERLINAALLASCPPAVYGIVQHFDGDPIAWGTKVTTRVVGTQGNAIFLGAALIMVAPLTLARLIDQLAQVCERRSSGQGVFSRLHRTLLPLAYLLLLVIQLLALVFTQSRGPFLGLLAGLVTFGIVFALYHRLRRMMLATAALTVTGVLFLVALNSGYAPLAKLRDVPYVTRLNGIFKPEEGTGKVRALIWQGAVELLAVNPLRDVMGYGPESLYVVFARFYPAELAHFEDRSVEPDRAHNETLDALIMTGIVGCLVELVLFLSLVHYILRLLDLSRTKRDRNAFVGTAVVGSVLGGSLPYALDGRFRFCGLGLPVGMFVGLIAYLIVWAGMHRGEKRTGGRAEDLVLMGLLAGIVGHFIEMQFGIVIATTGLYYWAFAGLAVAIGMRRSASRMPDMESGPPSLSEGGSALTEGAVAGLALIVLTFNFCVPTLDPRAHAGVLLGLFLSVWTLGLLLVVGPASCAATPRRCGFVAGRYAVVSLGLWLLFVAIYAPWIHWRPGSDDVGIETLRRFAAHIANAPSILYVSVFITMGIMTVASFGGDRSWPASGVRHRLAGSALYVALLLGVVPMIVCTNLDSSRADSFNKLGRYYEVKGQLDAAGAMYEEAMRLQPAEERYAVNLSSVLMEKARGPSRDTQPEREEYLKRGLAMLQRALADNPLNPHHPRNLARLYRLWAAVVDDPGRRARYVVQAETSYQEATQRSPHNAALWDEWATLYLEQGQVEAGVAKLDQSLRVDPGYTTTYWLRGNAHLASGDLERALSDYESALALQPTLLAAWSGKALALTRLNRFAEAIAANQRALALEPKDLISHRNLALLYRQTGNPDRALAEAQAALAVAHGRDRSDLEALVKELIEQRPLQDVTGRTAQ
ncbi:MAG: tetratricopeptide repeat protein [Candidatus Binatia bacterium]